MALSHHERRISWSQMTLDGAPIAAKILGHVHILCQVLHHSENLAIDDPLGGDILLQAREGDTEPGLEL